MDTSVLPHAGESGFIDERIRYREFGDGCTEKPLIAARIAQVLSTLRPDREDNAFRLFDAGIGNGAVLNDVLAAAHAEMPTIPFYANGREISLEDMRLLLPHLADRFAEHPDTVVTITNIGYKAGAPHLHPVTSAKDFVWQEVELAGAYSSQFASQLRDIDPFLIENWQTVTNRRGKITNERDAVLVIYRDDQRHRLNNVIPRQSSGSTYDYNLVIASQPYAAMASTEKKIENVIAPLAAQLAPGGKMIGFHSEGGDPAEEIINRLLPDYKAFPQDIRELMQAAKRELGEHAYSFDVDEKPLVYAQRELAISNSTFGTGAIGAAWNAASYVAQLPPHLMEAVMQSGEYLDVTRDVLSQHKRLWFNDTVYTIGRQRLAA